MKIVEENLKGDTLKSLKEKGLNSDNTLNDSDIIGLIDNYRSGEQYQVIISEVHDIVGMPTAKRRKAQFFSYGDIHGLVGTDKDQQKINNIKVAIKEEFNIYTGDYESGGEAINEVEQVDNQIIKLACCILKNRSTVEDAQHKNELVTAYEAGNNASPTDLAEIRYDGNVRGYGTYDHLMYCYIKSRGESDRIDYLERDAKATDFSGYEIAQQIQQDAGQSINKINNVLSKLDETRINNLFLDIQALSKGGNKEERGIGRSFKARLKLYGFFGKPEEVRNVNNLLGLTGSDELDKSDIITMYLALSRVAQKSGALVNSGKKLDEMELETLDDPLAITDGEVGRSVDAKPHQVKRPGRRGGVSKQITTRSDPDRLSNLMQQTKTNVGVKAFDDIEEDALSVADGNDLHSKPDQSVDSAYQDDDQNLDDFDIQLPKEGQGSQGKTAVEGVGLWSWSNTHASDLTDIRQASAASDARVHLTPKEETPLQGQQGHQGEAQRDGAELPEENLEARVAGSTAHAETTDPQSPEAAGMASTEHRTQEALLKGQRVDQHSQDSSLTMPLSKMFGSRSANKNEPLLTVPSTQLSFRGKNTKTSLTARGHTSEATYRRKDIEEIYEGARNNTHYVESTSASFRGSAKKSSNSGDKMKLKVDELINAIEDFSYFSEAEEKLLKELSDYKPNRAQRKVLLGQMEEIIKFIDEIGGAEEVNKQRQAIYSDKNQSPAAAGAVTRYAARSRQVTPISPRSARANSLVNDTSRGGVGR